MTDTAAKAAYSAGWRASQRAGDLDRAERRWGSKHPDPRAMFAAGWTDYAVGDRPKWYTFDKEGLAR